MATKTKTLPSPKRPQVNRLRNLREASKLTLAEVAKLCDCDESTVHCHEARKKAITTEAAERYAKIFKVATHELFLTLE